MSRPDAPPSSAILSHPTASGRRASMASNHLPEYPPPLHMNRGRRQTLASSLIHSELQSHMASLERLEPPPVLSPQKRKALYLSGSFGRYQQDIFNFLLLGSLVGAVHTMTVGFTLYDIDYWCAQPPDRNMSNSAWLEHGIPRDIDGSRSKCEMLSADGSRVPCQSWVYNRTRSFVGIQDKWNMVCDRAWLLSLSKTVFFIGGLMSFFMGPVSDNIGRLPVLLISVLIVEVAGLTLIVAQEVIMFLFCRFFLGFGLRCIDGTGATLGIELVEPQDRPVIITALASAWSVGVVLTWFFATYLHSWVQVQVAAMLPTICLLFFVRSVTESPRWCFAIRDMDRTRNIILGAARINRIDEEEVKHQWDSIMAALPEFQNFARERVSYVDLLGHKHMRTVVLIMGCCWTANLFLYYSLTLGNLGISDIIGPAVEVLGELIMVIVLTRCNRLLSSKVTLLLEALAPLPIYFFEGTDYIVEAAALLSRMVAAACYALIAVQALELCPTLMRSSGSNASGAIGLLGAIFAAFSQPIGEVTFPSAPYVAGAAFGFFTAWLIRYLPETRLRELPDTYRDMELMFERKNEVEEVNPVQGLIQHTATPYGTEDKEQFIESHKDQNQ